ncbi:hypothetical protein MKX62_23355 [Sporosarcina sp. FSL K6-5500]
MKDLIVTRRNQSKISGRKIIVDTDIKAASIIGVIIWWLKDGLYLDSAYIAEQINPMNQS